MNPAAIFMPGKVMHKGEDAGCSSGRCLLGTAMHSLPRLCLSLLLMHACPARASDLDTPCREQVYYTKRGARKTGEAAWNASRKERGADAPAPPRSAEKRKRSPKAKQSGGGKWFKCKRR